MAFKPGDLVRLDSSRQSSARCHFVVACFIPPVKIKAFLVTLKVDDDVFTGPAF
jgi:hypothetical protein